MAATILVLGMAAPSAGSAQRAERPTDAAAAAADEAAVRAALEHYLLGHATGQGSHFTAAFHDAADLFWIADGSLQTRTSAEYIAGAPGAPAPDEAERRRRIAWVEVAGDAAVARIELDYPDAFIVDYMTLLRTEEGWRIVSKAFHVDREGALSPTSAVASEADERARILAASAAFSRAYVGRDTAAIRDLYTEDAVLLPPGGEVRGRDAIVRYFTSGPRRQDIAHAMTSEDLRIDGDGAVDAGTWTHTMQMEGEEPRTASGRYLVTWRRGEDGRWRIEYDMWHRPEG